MNNFELAFKYVILNEGKGDNDPADRGGLTKWGITQETARIHRCFEHPHGIDVNSVDLKLAKHIYYDDFWFFDSIIDPSISIKLFDYAVNFGPNVAIRLAQETLNAKFRASLVVDGIFGKATSAVLNKVFPLKFIDALETVAGDRYVDIVVNDFINAYGSKAFSKRQLKFLKGWLRRLNRRFYSGD